MDNKYTNIKERVLYIAENKGISKEFFLKSIGMTYGSFKGIAKKGALNSNAIEKIYTTYKDVNIEWLLTGKGAMLLENDSSVINQSISGNKNYMAGKNLSAKEADISLRLEELKKQIVEKDAIIKNLIKQQEKLIDKL